jgi:hypothetical protein
VKTVTIDPHLDNVDTSPAIAVASVVDACSVDDEAVRLVLHQRDVRLVHVFNCARVRQNPARGAADLLALVVDRHHAASRADRINAAAVQLGLRPREPDEMIWTLGTGVDRCRPLKSVAFYRDEIVTAGRSTLRENPEHWTKVEIARLVGVCPKQVGEFLNTIRQAGYPHAADAVGKQLTRVESAG